MISGFDVDIITDVKGGGAANVDLAVGVDNKKATILLIS